MESWYDKESLKHFKRFLDTSCLNEPIHWNEEDKRWVLHSLISLDDE